MALFKKKKDDEENSPFQIKPKSKKKKIIIIFAIVLVLLTIIILSTSLKKSKVVPTTSTAKVDRGDITQVIEGSGTIEAIDQYEITSLVSGDILADYFEEGDILKKGDVMYKIDTSDLDNSIEKANLSIKKSQLSYKNAVESVNDLSIKTDKAGTITNLYIKNGDQVANGAKIADIVNNRTMTLSIDFLADFASNIYVGQTAQIELIGSFSTATGTVCEIATGSMPNKYGVSVTTIKIDVPNPGGILKGDQATAIIGDYACNSPGTFDYKSEITVVSKASGTVKKLNVSVNDVVYAGTILATLDNSSVLDSLEQSSISLQDAQLSLDNYNDKLEDYSITTPISGKVIQKNIKAGEKLDNTNASTPMAIISDLSSLVFTISVDELDISKISLGQTVNITADALEGQHFTGIIDNISIVGTSSNGVTSYPVKVLIDNSEECDLIPGMNVDATIVIAAKENVLRVPTTAVNRGNTVTLADGSQTKVELGLSDSSYIEIISGLKEGDEIIVPKINSASNPMGAMMGMAGGMSGGGMPSGMPSGMPGGMSGGGMSSGARNRSGSGMPGGR